MNKKKVIGKRVIFAVLGTVAAVFVKKYGRINYNKGFSDGYEDADFEINEENDELQFELSCMKNKLVECNREIKSLTEMNGILRKENAEIARYNEEMPEKSAKKSKGAKE